MLTFVPARQPSTLRSTRFDYDGSAGRLTALESLSTYLRTELSVIVKTPLVMVLGLGR